MRVTKVKPGDTIGIFKVLSREPSPNPYSPMWKVQCRYCKELSQISGSSLLRSSQAMGCRFCVREREKKLPHFPGARIGSLTLKSRATHAGYRSSWYATCDCGHVDAYRAKELYTMAQRKIDGCRICKPVVEDQMAGVDGLHYAYRDEMGLAMQQLYLNGLVPA